MKTLLKQEGTTAEFHEKFLNLTGMHVETYKVSSEREEVDEYVCFYNSPYVLEYNTTTDKYEFLVSEAALFLHKLANKLTSK